MKNSAITPNKVINFSNRQRKAASGINSVNDRELLEKFHQLAPKYQRLVLVYLDGTISTMRAMERQG